MKILTQQKRIKSGQEASSAPGLERPIQKLRSVGALMALVLAFMLAGFTLSYAQTFSASLSSLQKFNRPTPGSRVCGSASFGTFTSVSGGSTQFSYATQSFTVSTAGNYVVKVTSSTASDPMLFIYTGSFSSGSPTSNFMIGDDDSNGSLLPKIDCPTYYNVGTYVIVVTTYSSSTTSGTVYFSVSGAGSVNVLPTVTTSSVTGVGSNSATVGGNVTADGGAAVTARGVAYSTSQSPTSGVAIGSGTGSFSQGISGLTSGTVYYARAYATNSVGTAYGSQVSFTTTSLSVPTVSTTAVSSITINSASSGGNVTADGGASVTSKGVVWNTGGSPTISSYIGITSNGTGTGSYSSSMTSLSANTTYYVRAYATNSAGTSYGLQSSFLTAPADPTSITVGTATICSGASSSLTANGAQGTVYWYTAGCGTTYIGSGNPFSVSPTTTTTYYARNNNGNFSVGCANATVTVNQPATIPTSANGTASGTQSANLSFSGSTGTGTITYYWVVGTSPTVTYGAGVAQGSTTSTSATTSALSQSTTYYLRVYAGTGAPCGNSGYITSSSFRTYSVLTYSAGDNGSLTGSQSQIVANASNGSAVTAVPNSGYNFVNWSDGSVVNPRTDLNVTSSINVTANFAVNRLAFATQPVNSIAGANIPITVRITDTYGITMSSSVAAVTIAIQNNASIGGAGVLSGTLTVNAVAGVATFNNLSINKTGSGYTLRASAATPIVTTPVSTSFNITPAAIDHFTVVGITDPVIAGVTTSPLVTAYDQFDNIKTNYTGTISFSSAEPHNSSEIFPSNYTFLLSDNGTKSFANGITLKTTGERSVTVTGDTKTGTQTGITVNPAIINHFALSVNGTITAGTPFTVTATVYDEFGNIKTDYTGLHDLTWTTTATSSLNGTARIIPSNSVQQTFTSGVATISGFTFYNSQETPTITITDGPTASPGTTDPITVLNAPLDNFKVVAGTSQSAGVPFSVTVSARDVYWNTAITYAGSIRFKSSDDALVAFPGGLQSFVGYSGVRVFTGININAIGAYWLRAADSQFAFKSGQQENIVVGPGAFSRMTLSGSIPISTLDVDFTTRVAGEYVLVTLVPRDAEGNLLYACRNISVMLNGSVNNLIPVLGVNTLVPIVVTNVGDGSYTAIVRLTTVGINTLSASFNETAQLFDQTREVTVSPAPVDLAHSTITANPETMTTDQTSAITVQLKDQFDNNRTTSDGIVTLNTDHGILTGGVTDNGNGTYSATLHGNFGAVGTAHITGSLAGAISGAFTDTEDVIITEGAPSLNTIEITANPETITTNGTSIISIQLKDQFGNLITTNRGTVAVSTNLGALSSVIYTSGGIYQSTLSGFNPGFGPATITGTYNSGTIVDQATVTFNEGLPDLGQIQITASPTTMTSDGSSEITVQLRDIHGNILTTSRGVVTLTSTDRGYLSSVTDRGDGTYTAILTGDDRGFGITTIRGYLNGDLISDNATVTITEGKPNLAMIDLSSTSSTMTTDETMLISVQLEDQFGNHLTTQRGTVSLSTTTGALTPVTYANNGIYTSVLSTTVTGTATITGSLNDVADGVTGSIPENVVITIGEGKPALGQIQITASPLTISTDGSSIITIQLKDQWGNNLTTQRGTIELSSDKGSVSTPATYTSNGIYTATLTGDNRGVGTATVTGNLNDIADLVSGNITDNAQVQFTEGLPSLSVSDITVDLESITTDGSSTVTVQLKDQFGNLIANNRGTVSLTSTIGHLSAVTYAGVGTYTAVLTGDTRGSNGTGISNIAGTFVGTGSASGVAGSFTDTEAVTISEGLPSLATTLITANPITMTTDGTSTITVQLRDQFSNLITHERGTVSLFTNLGTLSTVTYSGANGIYNATLSGNNSGTGIATITGALSGEVVGTIADNATVTITEGVPSLTNATIIASPTTMTTDQTSTITVQLKDQFGNNLTTSRGTVTLATTLGTLSTVTDHSNGTYTAILSGNNTGTGTATISGALNAFALSHTATVTITEGLPSLILSTITPVPNSITTDQTSVITVRLKDQFGNNLTTSRGAITLHTTLGVLTSVTDYSNGTYSATLSANNTGTGEATITATLTGVVTGEFDNDAEVTINEGLPALSHIEISALPTSITADQTSIVTIQLKDQFGNNLTHSRGTITLSTSPIGNLSAVIDNVNGTYTSTFSLIASGTGTATITGNFAGTGNASGVNGAITDDATIDVTPGVATKLTIATQPSATAVAGVVFVQQPVIRIEDQHGNLVTSDNTTVVTAARSTGTDLLKGTLNATSSGGIATFTGLYYTKAESITLGFSSSPVLATVTSGAILVGPAPVHHFLLNAPSNFIAGSTRAAYTVTRYDVFNNLVTANSQVVYLFSSSTGANKKFYNAASAGSVINWVTIANGASSANFWYYDEMTGDHTITASDATPADGNTGIADATDQITVIPALLKNFLVYGVPDPHDLGTWQSVTVKALDTYDNVKTNYVGKITFSNTDIGATNPSDYQYLLADQGVHTFTNAVKFSQVGNWWLTAIDMAEPTKYGAQADITVQRAVTITANSRTKVYGDVLSLGTTGFNVTGIVAGYGEVAGEITGVTLVSTGTVATAEVGTYSIVPSAATGTFNPDFYRIVYSDAGELTVGQRTLTLSNFLANDKIYDRTTDVTGTGFSDNSVNNDELTFTYTAAFASRNAGNDIVVNYTSIAISGGSDMENYILASTTGSTTADITPKTLTPSVLANNKCYDGGTTATLSSQTVSGVISPDIVTLVVSASNFADASVGSGKIVTATGLTLEGTDAGNYTLGSNTSATATAQIYALPLPVISGEAIVCEDSETGYTTESGMTLYIWTASTGGTIESGQGTDHVMIDWNAPGEQTVSVNYADANGCMAAPATMKTITVNPIGQVNDPGDQVVCNGNSTTGVTFSTTNGVGVTTYSWTNDTPGIGLVASGTGNINSFTAVNTGTSPVIATITVTPTYTFGSVSCVGTPETFTYTVNPLPVISAQTATICSSTAFTVTPSGVPSGTTYTWSAPVINPEGSITGGSAVILGQSSISQTLTNTTTSAATATYTVTPLSGSCVGSTFDVTVTVNPIPSIGAQTAEICSATAFTVTPSGVPVGTTYTWSAPVISPLGSITGGSAMISAQSGISQTLTNTTTSMATATYTVTPLSGSCVGSTFTVTVTVNTKPIVSDQTATICSSTAFTVTPSGVPSGTTYTWSAPAINPLGSITGGHEQTSAQTSISEILTNTTTSVATATYTVTPLSGSCVGSTFAVTVTVNPKPQISAQTATICSATAFTVTPSGVPSGTTYTWSTPVISPLGSITGGDEEASAQSIISETLTNTTTSAATATYTVTPLSGSCVGSTFTVTVTVNPKPQVSDQTATTCSSTAFTVTPSGVPAGTTYTWGAPVISPLGSITGGNEEAAAQTSISQTLTNTTTSAATATYTVTPLSGSCVGSTFAVTVTVNPKPQVSDQTATICSSTAFTVTPSSVPTGTTYTWSAPVISPLGSVTGGSAVLSAQTSISQILTNTTASVATATYTVTPLSGSCTGSTFFVTVTVNPTAVMNDPADLVVCNGASTTVTFASAYTSEQVTYQWTNSNTAIGLDASGTGNIAFTATNSTASPVTATITVTPIFENVETNCPGVSQTFTITVRPIVVPTISGPASSCVGTSGVSYSTQAGMTGYTWSIDGGTIDVDGGKTVIVTWNTVGNHWLKVNYANSSGCSAINPTQYDVTVNSLPVPTIESGPASVCIGSTEVVYTTQPGMTNYLWTVSSGGSNTAYGTSVDDHITISWHGAGPQWIKINYTNENGCTATAQTQFNVTVNPLPTASISGNLTSCFETTLTAVTNAATPTFEWYRNNVLISGETAATLAVTTSGSYKVEIIDGVTECDNTSAASVVVIHPLPTASISGTLTACVTTTLNAITNAASPSYTWYKDGSEITGATTSTLAVTVSGAYTVEVSDGVTGCEKLSAASTVVINPLPQVTITGDLTACVTTTLTAVTNALTPSYVWYKDNVVINGETAATLVVNSSGAYKVKVADGVTQCENTSSASTVVINPLPTVSITGILTSCVTTTLTAVTNAGTPQYVWYKDNVELSGQTTSSLVVTVSGDYKVEVTDGVTGCEKLSEASTVIINPLPVVTITGDLTACATTTLTAVTNALTPSYVWYKDNVVINGETVATLVVNSSGAYKVKVADGVTQCENTSSASSVVINPLPTVALTGDLTACVTTTLTAFTNALTPSYVWYKDNVEISGQTASSLVVTTNGDYKVEVTDGVTGCENTSAASTVVINPLPTVTITGDLTACVTTTLTAVTDATTPSFVWYKDNVEISGATASTLVVTVSGAYKVEVTGGVTGCENTSAATNVVINPLPQVTITGDLTACVTTTLTAVTNALTPSYVWYKDNVVINGETAATLVVNSSGAYKVKVADGVTQCENTSSTSTVVINPLPTVSITGILTSCVTTTLTAVTNAGTPQYVWYKDNVEISGQTTSSLVVTVSGDYKVEVTDGVTGCENTSSASTVMINPLPTVSITGDLTACVTTTLTAITDATTPSFVWYKDNVEISGATASTLVVTVSGAYKVEVTGGVTGCENTSAATNVVINPLPTVGITGDLTACVTTTLTAVTNALTPSFVWYKDNVEISGATVSTLVVTVSGAYKVEVTDGVTSCEKLSDASTVVINPLPQVTITGDLTACVTTTLTAVTDATTPSFVWYKDNVEISGATASTLVVTVSGAYKVEVMDGVTGCENTSDVSTVVINPLPTVAISGELTACATTTLTAVTNALTPSFVWYKDNVEISGATASTLVVTVSGAYKIEVTDGVTSCEKLSDASTVVINPLPQVTITGDLTACVTTTLTAVTDALTPSFTWYKDNVEIGGATASTLVVTVSGAYKVEVTDGVTSCENTSDASTVVINPRPTVAITGGLVGCATTTLTAVTNAITPSFTWYKDNVEISGATASTLVVTISGAYKVEVIDGVTGCENTSIATNVVINPLPTVAITGDLTACITTTLTTNTNAVTPSYVWYENDVLLPGETASTLVVTSSGNYKVKVTDGVTGCENTSTSASVTINQFPYVAIEGELTACATTTLTVITDAVSPTYEWFKNNVEIVGATGSSLVVTSSGDYKAEVTDGTTGCEPNSATSTVIINPLPTAFVSLTGPSTICAGGSTTISVVFTGTAPWDITYTDGTTPGTVDDIVANPYIVSVNPPAGATTTYTITNVTDNNGCSNTGSGSASVTVRPVLVASTASGSQTLCYGSSAAALSASPATGGSNGTFTYKWQSSTDNVVWTDISGATIRSYAPGVIYATTYYRILATDALCGSISSNVVQITVYDPLTKPVISSDQTICSGATAAALTAVGATGGSGNFTYQWQKNTSGSWINVGTGSLIYEPGVITVATQFRLISNNIGTPNCGASYSNIVIISMASNVSTPVFTLGATSIRCQGAGTVTYTATATNTTGISYSLDNLSTTGGNSIDALTGQVTFSANWSGTTIITASAAGCNGPKTAIHTVTVTPTVGAPVFIIGSETTCQNSDDEQYTASATNSTSVSYSVLPVEAGVISASGLMDWNSDFHGIATITATAVGCNGPVSSHIQVTVLASLVASTASLDQTICYGATAGQLSSTSATGGTGSYTYQWQSSTNGIDWSNQVAGLTYSPGTLYSTTYFRVVSTDVNCGSAVSNTVTVTVNNPFTEPVISGAQTICYNTEPEELTAVGATGGSGDFSYQWQMKTTGSWSNVGTDALVYQPEALTTTTTYRLIADDKGPVNCGAIFSNEVVITVNSEVLPGTIGSDQLISSGTAPTAITSITPGSGYGAFTYAWESSIDGGSSWSTISGATGPGYAPGVLNLSTWYRRVTVSSQNSLVCSAMTAPVKINVTIKVNVKVNLEGPLNGSNVMNIVETFKVQIPLTQPYNRAPWNYQGTESVSALPDQVVDWVMVELRQATVAASATSSTILAKRAAFIRSDGTIVDLDGVSTVRFDDHYVTTPNNLYIVVRHRNHLAVMSSSGATLSGGVYSYDFTTGLNKAYGGGSGYKQVGSTFAMVAGDIDKDGNVYVSDYNRWTAGFGTTNGYFDYDLDMDGFGYISDYNKWSANFGSSVNSTLKSAQLKPKYFTGVPE